MKKNLMFLLLSLVATGVFAQDPPGVPASTNVPGAEYPRILPDLSIVFRLKAPSAQTVRLHLDKDYDLVRESDGVWSVTTTPQVPGFHYYWFILDGVNVCDPASETFYGVSRQYSGIEIPEAGVDFYLPKAVPHGEVRERWYFAKTTQEWRRIFVYTPPGSITLRRRVCLSRRTAPVRHSLSPTVVVPKLIEESTVLRFFG